MRHRLALGGGEQPGGHQPFHDLSRFSCEATFRIGLKVLLQFRVCLVERAFLQIDI